VWNAAITVAAASLLFTVGYVLIRWRRSPSALRGMFVVGGACLLSGLLGGVWLFHLATPSSSAISIVPEGKSTTLPSKPILLAQGSPQAPAAGPTQPATPEPTYVTPYSCNCGSERWPVKTLTDEDKLKVNLAPVVTTISDLIKIEAPRDLPRDHRIAPVELTTYVVKAVVIEFKKERDDDFHVVIADPADLGKTMIAEIPEPCCAEGSPQLEAFKKVRAAFTSWYNPSTSFIDPQVSMDLQLPLWSYLAAKGVGIDAGHPLPAPVANNGVVCGEPAGRARGASLEITGIGFFDFQHGQNGVAPNAIELHPVLSVKRLE
jgi:hypothetical protein